MNVILGAGLSGLICGALNAQSRIYERNPKDFVSHRAVLRFRDEKIARSLGIAFRAVKVRKSIWTGCGEEDATPRLANLYSMKVRGAVTEASIWNLAPSERFIAPDNLHAQLADICGGRVTWNCEIHIRDILQWRIDLKTIISTLPLPVLIQMLYSEAVITRDPSDPFPPLLGIPFVYSPIHVNRYQVPDCDVFQTVYFPASDTDVYRATLTGSLLTIESVAPLREHEMEDVVCAFGITGASIAPMLRAHKQSFGKISPVQDGPRKALLHKLTKEWGIYSLGRFATWRNILLDDVYDDIAAIRRMMALSNYDVNLERTKQS